MKRFFATLFTLILVISSMSIAVLADDELEFTDPIYQKFKGKNISINVYNWGEYISDGSDDSVDVNAVFEELTGIKVNYTLFASNEELYAKLKSGGADYDVIIPSDYMINRMIVEGMIQKLDYKNIPNFKNIHDDFKNLSYDPENEYTVPYTWGTVGIIYNTTMIEDEFDSWDILWDERYLGNILMFSNPRDAFGISLKRLGYSMNTTNTEELDEAAEELKKQKALVQAYVMDEIFDKMGNGEAVLAPYYAGDALVMIDENPDLSFVVPKEGTNRFVDAMCIPVGAKQKEAAELYINFMSEAEIGLANAEYIGYSSPNAATLEIMDEEMKADEIAYPSNEVIEKTEVFFNLPNETNQYMQHLWTEIISSDTGVNPWVMPVILVGGVAASISITVYRKIKKRHKQY